MPKITGSHSETRKFRGRTVAQAIDFQAVANEHLHILSGDVSGESTVDDIVYTDYTSALVQQTGHLVFIPLTPQQTVPVYRNATPGICSVTDSHVDWVANGIGRVVVKGRYGSRVVEVPVSQTGGTTGREFNRFVDNTLAKVLSDTVDALLIDGKDQNYFSVKNHDTKSYTINPNWFGYGVVDLTFKSVWNNARPSGYQDWQPSLLISPKYSICTRHYNPPKPIGTIDRFVEANGTVHEREIVDQLTTLGNDSILNEYDEDLPAGVVPALLMEADWRSHYSYSHGVINEYIPYDKITPSLLMASDQDCKVTIWEPFYVNNANQINIIHPTILNRDEWNYPFGMNFVVGDSGSPLFARYSDGRSMLLTGVSNGDDWSQYLTTINNWVDSGYEITPQNFGHLEMYIDL